MSDRPLDAPLPLLASPPANISTGRPSTHPHPSKIKRRRHWHRETPYKGRPSQASQNSSRARYTYRSSSACTRTKTSRASEGIGNYYWFGLVLFVASVELQCSRSETRPRLEIAYDRYLILERVGEVRDERASAPAPARAPSRTLINPIFISTIIIENLAMQQHRCAAGN